jgi:hypothetical protein
MSSSLSTRYTELRHHTLQLAAPLSAEDQCVQSMPDTSPTKWHLAHTSWFFESLVLKPFSPNYRVFDEAFAFLFNSGGFKFEAQRALVIDETPLRVF